MRNGRIRGVLAGNLPPKQIAEFAPESIAQPVCVDPSDPASLTDFTISCFEVFLPRLPLSRTPRVKINPDFNIRVVVRRLFSRRATRSARDTPGLEVMTPWRT
jgi:hypothetical protein